MDSPGAHTRRASRAFRLCPEPCRGCAGLNPVPAPTGAPFSEHYQVGASDELRVTILPDPVTQEDVVVRPDGMISISLAGDVQASGRTVAQIAADIEQRISAFKRGAKVDVALVKANSTAITVLGEVRGRAVDRADHRHHPIVVHHARDPVHAARPRVVAPPGDEAQGPAGDAAGGFDLREGEEGAVPEVAAVRVGGSADPDRPSDSPAAGGAAGVVELPRRELLVTYGPRRRGWPARDPRAG